MMFWPALKLEISYYRVILLDFGFFLLEDFLKIIFLHGEIFLSFRDSSFALRYNFLIM
jgi:hypothetical protein